MDGKVAVDIQHIKKEYKTYAREFDRFREVVSIGHKRNLHGVFTALQDVNLQVYSGECVGIIGTNGSGKSTLLKIVTGVLQPTSGNVKLNGKVSALLELGAGFNGDYTGLQNIILNGRIMGYSDEEIMKRVPEIEAFAEIGDFINQPVKVYSSGMFARLAFAVAINVDPDILIVDEALSVGDIFFQTKCYHKFEEFRKAGKTILFVSHDLGSVIKYCDRCLLLDKGRQVMVGNCKEVTEVYRKILVKQYDESNNLSSGVSVASSEEKRNQAFASSEEEWKKSVLQNPNYIEYGDHTAEIVDFGLCNAKGEITSMLMKGEEYSVLIRYRANKTLHNPIFAFTIKDHKGTELCGTNTMLQEMTKEQIAEGTEGVVRFKQRMVLQGGQYFLSLGLTGYEGDELVVRHRLYDICHIQVLSDYNTVGFFDPESEITYL